MSVEVQAPMNIENSYGRTSISTNKDEHPNDDNDGDNPNVESPTESTTLSLPKADQVVLFSPELLQMYYSRLFPYSFMYSWLSYGSLDPTIFSRREFSFTLDVNGQEIYLRYQSFTGAIDLQKAILARRPAKIDIGAVFSYDPSQKSTLPESRFQPVQREFVLDVDLTDYDDVRHCGCQGAKICPKCWTFMNMAVKVVNDGLRQDFGFQHIAWFYSGRRGVHAWVCDESARFLTDEGRSAVASYFEVDLGSDRNKDVKLQYPLHPMLKRAYATLEPLFIKSVLPLEGHGLLEKQELWEPLLDSIPEGAEQVRDNIKKDLSGKKGMSMTPAEKWNHIKTHIDVFVGYKAGQKKSSKNSLPPKQRERIESWQYEVVFRYTYPRLDINVSKKRNHLLKSPFCVHPKTGRVCVPIQPETIDTFDPFTVPTLPQLMNELDEYDRDHEQETGEDDNNDIQNNKFSTDGQRQIPNWQKTSLRHYYEPFEQNFLEPLRKDIRRKEKDISEEEAARIGDF